MVAALPAWGVQPSLEASTAKTLSCEAIATPVGMSVVQHRRESTQVGGITGRGFVPGQSGNPGGDFL